MAKRTGRRGHGGTGAGTDRGLWRRLRREDPHAAWRPEPGGAEGAPADPTWSTPPPAPLPRPKEDDWEWRPETETAASASASGREATGRRADAAGEPDTRATVPVGPADAGQDILFAEDLVRTYRGRAGVTAVRGASIRVRPGDFVALIGPSGSGKTTFLGLLAGLDRPDEGHVSFRGRSMPDLDADALRRLRRKDLGMVFQSFGLLPTLSALENVELPLRIAGGDLDEAREAAASWLVRLGLGNRLDNRTFELSAGQQQRVAVARALVIQPDLVLADEPIAEVDTENADLILDALAEVSRRGGAVVAATHNPAALAYANTVVLLRDGKVEAAGTPEELAGRLSTD